MSQCSGMCPAPEELFQPCSKMQKRDPYLPLQVPILPPFFLVVVLALVLALVLVLVLTIAPEYWLTLVSGIGRSLSSSPSNFPSFLPLIGSTPPNSNTSQYLQPGAFLDSRISIARFKGLL